MKIRERLTEILDTKRGEIRVNSHVALTHALTRFVDFFESRGVTDSARLTIRDVIALRDSWQFLPSTKILNIRRVKFLLRRLGREDILREFRTPRMSKTGKPMPYSDAEIAAFRAVASPRVELFFLTSIQTGLALADLVKLDLCNLRDGCVVTKRQKTGKECIVPIPAELFSQLRLALPFYSSKTACGANGAGAWMSGVTLWADRMRVTQQKAGIYRKGNLVHRGRDSFVERQLAAGVPVAVIAARIGDRVDTLLSHYSDLLSPKMRDLNLAQPVVTI